MTERNAYLIIKEHLLRHLNIDGDAYKLEELTKHVDFYLEKGCPSLGIEPNTGIELKQRFISDTFRQLQYIYDHELLSALIVVTPEANKQDRIWQSTVTSGTYGWLKGRNIRLVELNDFLAECENDEYVKSIIIEQSEKNYDEKANKIAFEQAKRAIHDNDYTLYFGAGVSVSAGLPSWDALLEKVAKKVFENKSEKISAKELKAINACKYCSHSPLILAQYLTTMLDTEFLFEYVRDVLYRKSPSDYSLIDALIELAEAKRPESIITYNYDDLFEERAANKKSSLLCRSIFDDNRVQGLEMPVYHVHGVLPRNNEEIQTYKIILDEKSYHYESKDAFLWSNVEQMHALRRTTCLFIGLSMTDPNLRRLLDITQREYGDEEIYHYAFLKEEPLLKNINTGKDKENMAVFEKMLKELGVQVIWYNQHFELPGLIKQLI